MGNKYSFEAETSQILQLLTHSIYSNKEIFLRELVSNASDAIDKAKIKSLTDVDYLGENRDFKIKISINKDDKSIVIEDNGIGMTQEEVIKNIGTIAKSGTKEFLEKLKESKTQNNLIGQFGVGFYSAFMVANKVKLETKSNHSDTSVVWISDGKGEYELADGTKQDRGTVIELFLNEENIEFLEEWKIKELIQKYSNYISIPVELYEEDSETKTHNFNQVNQTTPLWNKNKSEIKQEELDQLYSSISYDFTKPLTHIITNSEGVVSYKSILFVPQKTNSFKNFGDPQTEYGPKLFIQNVMVLENAKDLLPVWLRFVSGVVQTSDLPLNISREMLQSNTVLDKIKKSLTKKVIDAIDKQKDQDNYDEFISNYKSYLKEGVYYDSDNKQKILGLLKFDTLLESKSIFLDDYIKNENIQKDKKIYYILAKNKQEALSNPYIEQFRENKVDVLLLTDNIDEWLLQAVSEYNEFKLVSITSNDVSISKNDEQSKEELETKNKDFKDLLELTKNIIGTDKIEKVQLSQRLGNSIGALIIPQGGMTPQMEKMLKSMGQQVPAQKKILEINPNNDFIKSMLEEFKNDLKSQKLQDMIKFVYEQAILLEGGELDDVKSFVDKIAKWIK